MASRFGAGPGTTSAGAFFQNQRPAYMRMASDQKPNGMPQPQMQPLNNSQNGHPPNGAPGMRQVRQQASNGGGTSRGPTPGGGPGPIGGGGGSGKRMDRKDTKDVAWVHWRALKDFLAAWADKGESGLMVHVGLGVAEVAALLRWHFRQHRTLRMSRRGSRRLWGARGRLRSDLRRIGGAKLPCKHHLSGCRGLASAHCRRVDAPQRPAPGAVPHVKGCRSHADPL